MGWQDLRQVPIFASFSDEQLAALQTQGQEVRLQPGQVLFNEGDSAQGLFVILEGELEILKSIGGQSLTLARRGASNRGEHEPRIDGHSVVVAAVQAGSFVGETSLLTGLPHSAAARATMPTVCLKYDVTLFAGLRDSPLNQLVLMTMVERLRDTESQVQQHQKLSALGKMAAGLAHELNNPASANLRAATQLPQTLDALQAQTLKLYGAGLNAEQLAFLTDLQSQLVARAANSARLDALAQSDREDAITAWLDDAEIAESWRLAPVLASAGMDADELNTLRDRVGDPLLAEILCWLESGLSIAGLSYTLKQSATRIAGLIEAVKAYTYMDQSPLQELDIHAGLESTLVILQHKLAGIDIRRSYDRSLAPITALGSELNQVWTILLDNAADALADSEHGAIILRTARDNDYLLVEIGDNGPGIPAEVQARLFEPFITTKPVGQGTGLGLSIARRIVVERHHGMINVSSQPGDTRFLVYLPLNTP